MSLKRLKIVNLSLYLSKTFGLTEELKSHKKHAINDHYTRKNTIRANKRREI